MRKSLIAGFIFLILATCILVYNNFLKHKKPDYYWRTVKVEKGDIHVFVTATGTLAADTSVDVGVQVSGIIAKIKVDFNDRVKKGQVIAVLDTTLYYATKLDAEATLQKMRFALQEAKREFDRSTKLLQNKVLAQADYDVALTNYQTAQGNLTSAQAQLNRAAINLRYCTITAPISGTIINRNVQVGNMVIASFNSPVLFTIAYDMSEMQVQADIDEADIGQIKIGQLAMFTVDAYPNEVFKGEVIQIRHQPVMVQNVVNYIAIIKVENTGMKLIPGLTATCNISIEDRKNVIKIPSNAFSFIPPVEYISKDPLISKSEKEIWEQKIILMNEQKKSQISESTNESGDLWIKRNNDLIPIRVTKGLNDGIVTEILGNLQAGEEVVTGINQSDHSALEKSTQNPFMPKFPSNKK